MRKLIVRTLLIASLMLLVTGPVRAVNGPETDIYYYTGCNGTLTYVGHAHKNCYLFGWTYTGQQSGDWSEVVTYDCDTQELKTTYYKYVNGVAYLVSQATFNAGIC
ncbi:MAG TPA: hypothetical protein VEK57_28500 [Thermoanaerobaculia bacterium]|nr:hypothetical protein [Thermoanaerobaculia bacterium]